MGKLARAIDRLSGLNGLSGDLKQVLFIGGAAGLAMIGTKLLFDKIPFLANLPWWGKALSLAVVGGGAAIGVGRMAGKDPKSPLVGAGAGIAGAMIGLAVAETVSNLMPASVVAGLGYGSTGFGYDKSLTPGIADLGDMSTRAPRMLEGGFGDLETRQPRSAGGYTEGLGYAASRPDAASSALAGVLA